MTEQNNDILFDLRDGIGRVTFNRPQARNAFTFQMYERVAEICEQANKDRAIKVLIFTGAGDKAFASGTDINQFRAFATPQDAIDYEARNDRVLGVLEKLPRADHRGDRRRLHRRRRRRSRPAATCASAPKPPNSVSRSRARSATACRWRTMAGSRHCSVPRA